MKKYVLLFFIIIFSSYGYTQVSFQAGYYIDSDDTKINCYIKNVEWRNNPTEFKCKLKEDGSEELKTIESVKEFGIIGKSKYIKQLVHIDRSSKNLSDLSTIRESIFTEEELFLAVLVEGEASLYMYEDGSLRRFFYNLKNANTEQLIFKNYKTKEGGVGENNKFKRQLWDSLKCQEITLKDIERLDYNKSELTAIVVRFNECSNASYTNFTKKNKTKVFHLSLRPGFKIAKLSFDNSVADNRDVAFDTKYGFSLGLEAEFVLSFNANKWAIIAEPTYQYYKAQKETEMIGVVHVDYTSLELPVGLRYYMFLNKKSKLFIDGAIVFDFVMNDSSIDFESINDVTLKSGPNFALGLGYKINNKLGLELRYFVSRDVLQYNLPYSSDYKALSVIIGYTLF